MSDDSITIIEDEGSEKLIPHGLMDIMDIVYKYHAWEGKGASYPEDFFTPKDMFEYSECGFFGSVKSGLLSLLLTPVAFGVIERAVPIFGDPDPSVFDKVFSFILALSFTIGYALLLMNITRRYVYPFTKRIIKNFLCGVIGGKLFITGVAFFLYHYLYIKVLTEDNVAHVLSMFRFLAGAGKLQAIHACIMEFRQVLLTSAWFIVLTAMIFISIPLIGIAITIHRNKPLKEED